MKTSWELAAMCNRTLLVVVSISVIAGCSRILDDALNPKYCAAHPMDPDCQREFPDAFGCTSNGHCSAPTSVCALDKMMCVQCTDTDRGACAANMPACSANNVCVPCTATDRGACSGAAPACSASNTCVQCTATDRGACAGNMPVCGANDMCRPCISHVDCPSNACLPSGACGDDTNVAYVDPTGTGTTCTKAGPCVKVDDALKTGRPFVKFHGATDEQLTVNNRNVTFLADPQAKLTSMSNGILLKVDGSSQLVIYDLEISGASGANSAGISLQPGNTATVSLIRTTIARNSGVGISASGGTLSVSQSNISENLGGGISLDGSSFTITNNFICRNGNVSTAIVGGVALAAIPGAGNRFEFNTIVSNLATGGVTNSGGVLCDQAGFVASRNLIFRNQGGPGGNVQTLGLCQYGNSFVSVGTSSTDNAPMFVHPNSPPFDYHLTSASPSTVVDVAGACTGDDFDGDARPVGAACDVGADERKP
jgi:hypothetical protein